jgi:hypothetical protein
MKPDVCLDGPFQGQIFDRPLRNKFYVTREIKGQTEELGFYMREGKIWVWHDATEIVAK